MLRRDRLAAVASLAIALAACGEHEVAPQPVATITPEPPAPPPPPPPPVRAGPLCTYHGVCWASPFPQGNALHALRVLAADRVLSVGDRGTILAYDGHDFRFEDAPTRERLLDLADAPTGELFAVGERGTILTRGGDGAWSAMTSGTTATLRAVIALAANDVIAVGEGALVLHGDGTSFAPETLPADLPIGVDLIALTHRDAVVYALGARMDGDQAQRLVLAREAGAWRVLSTTASDANAIAALSDGTFILSGTTPKHGDGTRWTEHSSTSDRPLDALIVRGPDDAYAGGFDGRIANWDGHRWRSQRLDVALDIDDLDGIGGGDVWAVGEHGLIARRSGVQWTTLSSGSTGRLEGVHGLSRDDVWAVGENVSLHWDGHAWSASGPDDAELEALGGTSDAMFAVGGDGSIRRYAGGTWTTETSGTRTKLEGIWVTDATHAIAVGGSEWTQRDGETWTALTDRPAATGIWGSAANDVWSAGGGGLEHFDGSAWTPVSGTESTSLFAVWGAAANDVWAVGAEGHVMHFDGARWSPVDADTSQDLVGVWGRNANDVWAVGQHGTLIHWDGERWRWRDSGTDELLHAVWGSEAGELWIVGHGGVVLRVGPT